MGNGYKTVEGRSLLVHHGFHASRFHFHHFTHFTFGFTFAHGLALVPLALAAAKPECHLNPALFEIVPKDKGAR